MAHYAPLFPSLTTGTLCGRWPDIGLWPIVLSLADWHGIVDVTPDYLARVTGLSIEEICACMRRFCEPDAGSRSKAEGGARLVLIDPARDWGWRIVNLPMYREKARKAAYDAARTTSGRDAERKAIARSASREVPTSPDASREVPLLNIKINEDVKKNSGVLEDSDSRPRRARTRERPAYEGQKFHDQVISAYHDLLPDLAPVKVWSTKRRQALNARISERCKDGKPADTVDYWRKLFQTVAASDFLCGRATPRDGREPFRADLEWILRPENFVKVIEGKYGAPRVNGAAHVC